MFLVRRPIELKTCNVAANHLTNSPIISCTETIDGAAVLLHRNILMKVFIQLPNTSSIWFIVFFELNFTKSDPTVLPESTNHLQWIQNIRSHIYFFNNPFSSTVWIGKVHPSVCDMEGAVPWNRWVSEFESVLSNKMDTLGKQFKQEGTECIALCWCIFRLLKLLVRFEV